MEYPHDDCPHPSTKDWIEFCNKHKSREQRIEGEINYNFACDVMDLILKYYHNSNVNYYELIRNLNLAFLSVACSNLEKNYNIKTPPYKMGKSASDIADFAYNILEEFGITKTKLPKSYIEDLR
ncbi:MAG: hypothetical protein ACXW2E_12835 [Nitrososphaeraceae archaeon]